MPRKKDSQGAVTEGGIQVRLKGTSKQELRVPAGADDGSELVLTGGTVHTVSEAVFERIKDRVVKC